MQQILEKKRPIILHEHARAEHTAWSFFAGVCAFCILIAAFGMVIMQIWRFCVSTTLSESSRSLVMIGITLSLIFTLFEQLAPARSWLFYHRFERKRHQLAQDHSQSSMLAGVSEIPSQPITWWERRPAPLHSYTAFVFIPPMLFYLAIMSEQWKLSNVYWIFVICGTLLCSLFLFIVIVGACRQEKIEITPEGLTSTYTKYSYGESMIHWDEALLFLTYSGPDGLFKRVRYYELVGERISVIWRLVEPQELKSNRYHFPLGYEMYSQQMQLLHATIRERAGLTLFNLDEYNYP